MANQGWSRTVHIRWAIGVVLAGVLVGVKVMLSGAGGAASGQRATAIPPATIRSSSGPEAMGMPPASGGALPTIGQRVDIVVQETTDPRRNALAGTLLRKTTDGSYRATGRAVRIRWRSSVLPVVMGTSQDVHAGAVLQIIGTSDGRADATATQIVVLTGYATVTGGASMSASGSSGSGRGAAPTVNGGMHGTVPQTGRVIAGFSQMAPGSNHSTEATETTP
jgi:hypothetical protein